MDELRDMLAEWKWSIGYDPEQHFLSFMAGFWGGMFLGASIMWWAIS